MNVSFFSRTALTGGGLLPLVLLACSSQAGPDYQGESLMTIHGKVTIENPAAPSSLVPVLTFPSYVTDDGGLLPTFSVMDVDVRGDFPSNFTLDVFQPPPEEARSPWLSFGFIAAMPPDHPKKLVQVRKYDELIKSGCLGGDDGGLVGGKCEREYMRCEPSNAPQIVDETTGHCYHDVYSCDPEFTHCVHDHGYGDPNYAKGLWQNFAGLSRNYMVLYVAMATPTTGAGVNSGVLLYEWALNGGKPLEPGYHLLRLGTLSGDEAGSNAACLAAAKAEATARYNDAHGTSWTFDGLDPQPDRAALEEENLDEVRLRLKKGCRYVSPFDGHTYSLVPSGQDHPVTVELGTEVRPVNEGLPPLL